MKKFLSLLLAAMMLLSFAACSGGGKTAEATQEPTEAPTAEPTEEPKETMEEMLAEAAEVDFGDITHESINNLARAKSLYCNKTLLLSEYIVTIESDHIEIGTSQYVIDVYLPLEDMINLQENQMVTIVGETDDSYETTTSVSGGYTFSRDHYRMPFAYLVKDRYERTGVLRKDGRAFYLETKNGFLYLEFADEVDSVEIESLIGKEITIGFKYLLDGSHTRFFDAVIVK